MRWRSEVKGATTPPGVGRSGGGGRASRVGEFHPNTIKMSIGRKGGCSVNSPERSPPFVPPPPRDNAEAAVRRLATQGLTTSMRLGASQCIRRHCLIGGWSGIHSLLKTDSIGDESGESVRTKGGSIAIEVFASVRKCSSVCSLEAEWLGSQTFLFLVPVCSLMKYTSAKTGCMTSTT